jgi:hypothetical protein
MLLEQEENEMKFKFRRLDKKHLEMSVYQVSIETVLDYEDAVQLLREFQNVVEELEYFIEQTER